jgi:hypothetical protein
MLSKSKPTLKELLLTDIGRTDLMTRARGNTKSRQSIDWKTAKKELFEAAKDRKSAER